MTLFRSLRAVFLVGLLTLLASTVVAGQQTDDEMIYDGATASDSPTDSMEVIDAGTPSRFDDLDASEGCIISDAGRGRSCKKNCGCPKCCAAQCNADPYNRVLPQNGWMSVRGWVDGGILGNTSNPPSHFNGPYNATEVDNGQLNQFYLVMERTMAADGSWTYARCDLLYGSDFNLAQSTGFELNPNGTPRWNSNQFDGLALPQAYVEVGTKYNSLKVGHFYTLVGYEGVQSPTNFFYSHAYSYMFAGPFTQWGAIGSSKLGDNWHLQGGIVNGWNNLVQTQNHGNFLGNIKYTGAGWWGSLAVITGDEFDNPANLPNVAYAYTNRTRYSAIFDKQIGPNFEYLFHQWLGSQSQGAPGGGTALWYGIDQYAYYRLTDTLRLGTRIEWFRDQSGTRVGLTEQSNPNKAPLPGNYVSWTAGVNWNPTTNILLRPEIRWDSYRGPASPYDDGQRSYQFLLGFDAIAQF